MTRTMKTAKRKAPSRARGKPRLLAGGNPQIAKAEGAAPVRAWIGAIAPGWKREGCRNLDALIADAVPGVRKAVKWNSPLYGAGEHGWFLALHCTARYIKVAFFQGMALRPLPPVASAQDSVRYFHLHEDDALDAAQFRAWVKQASRLPGRKL